MNRELHARADGRFTDAKLVSVAHTEPVPARTRRLDKLPDFVTRLSAEGALVSHLKRDGEEILMVVNRDPVRFMRLEVAFVPGVKRVLEDGTVEDTARYGEVYRLDPGYAEIFVMAR